MFSYLKVVHVVCKGVNGIGDLRRKNMWLQKSTNKKSRILEVEMARVASCLRVEMRNISELLAPIVSAAFS